MRWRGRRQSGNVIDARGRGGARGGGARGGGALAQFLPLLLGGMLRGGRRGRRGGRGQGPRGGIGCLLLVVVLIVVGALATGINPLHLLDGGAAPPPVAGPSAESSPQDEAGEFVSVVLADTEDTWHRLFQERGGAYREPQLVLFTSTVRSGCGISGEATGPFYCPLDDRVYLDLSFFQRLEQLGASGEFAVAYVIAHEVGHHIQQQQGLLDQVRAEQQRLPQAEANALQVRVELQADCYAGVWAHYADRDRDLLSPGDLQNGLDAAAAVGSDHLARQAGRPVQPETFTHGTSEQRQEWFTRGFESGDPAACDTFMGL